MAYVATNLKVPVVRTCLVSDDNLHADKVCVSVRKIILSKAVTILNLLKNFC